MMTDIELSKGSILIVTGSSLQAELYDRPLAYQLKAAIEGGGCSCGNNRKVLVLGDLWYLNTEVLHRMPTISIGAPEVNSLSAYLLRRLTKVLVVENTLTIQMDPGFEDLRVSLWGANEELTREALEIFVNRAYLERFLTAAERQLQ